MTKTPIAGYTIPDANTDLGDLTGVIAQGFFDIENALYLPVDSKSVTAAHDTYPVGISLLPLSAGTPAAGWPAATGVSLVVTMRRGNTANGAWQFWVAFFTGSEPQVKTRTGSDTGWSPWAAVAGPGLPVGTASGELAFPSNSASEQRTITFAAGVFKAPPNVVATAEGGGYVASVSAISSAGCTIQIDPQQGGSAMASTADRFVQWIAMENY